MIRAFILRYIARKMSNEDYVTRAAIFKAINDGMAKAHYEDNATTRLNFTVLQLVNAGADFHPYPFLGQTVVHDRKALASAAYDAVMESCANDRQPRWAIERDAKVAENRVEHLAGVNATLANNSFTTRCN